MNNTPEQIRAGRDRLRSHLQQHSEVWRTNQPLSVTIRQDAISLLKRLKVPRKRFVELLAKHCQQPEYVSNIANSADRKRYTLEGVEAGAITEEHKESAKLKLESLTAHRSA